MDVTRLEVGERQLKERVLPLLLGRAFHTTRGTAFELIKAAGSVEPNTDGQFPFNHSFSRVSHSRKMGWVSVNDLRELEGEVLARALSNYYFLDPAFEWPTVVHLVLGEAAVSRLVTWEEATRRYGLTIQGVPHLESGHPGPLPLKDIDAAIIVEIERDPELEALRDAGRWPHRHDADTEQVEP